MCDVWGGNELCYVNIDWTEKNHEKKREEEKKKDKSDNYSISENFAFNGNLRLLIDAYNSGIYLCKEDVFQNAVYGGYYEVLQWLLDNGCPWNKDSCTAAAESGNLNVLQWLRANGCPWDKDSCTAAAESGHLNVLQWLHENGCPWDGDACTAAAKGRHIEVLKFLYIHDYNWGRWELDESSKYPEVLKLLFDKIDADYNAETVVA
jgi:hypothetical protein